MSKKIILASGSPRRQELLRQMGITDFSIQVSSIEENYPPYLTPSEIVAVLAEKKCRSVWENTSQNDTIVIAADTMVFWNDTALGKPHDEAEALQMLQMLQGSCHIVYTGVNVRCGTEERHFVSTTKVFFRPAAKEELLRYIQSGDPLDKAGAYGIQGRGALLVKRIEGDFYNVMGLPITKLADVLLDFGVVCL